MKSLTLTSLARRSIFAAILVVAVLPLGYTPARGVATTPAYCQDGSCCPEEGSYCVIGGDANKNYYFKASGPCKLPPVLVP